MGLDEFNNFSSDIETSKYIDFSSARYSLSFSKIIFIYSNVTAYGYFSYLFSYLLVMDYKIRPFSK